MDKWEIQLKKIPINNNQKYLHVILEFLLTYHQNLLIMTVERIVLLLKYYKEVLKKWTDKHSKCYVLERNSKVQGLYYIRANHEGGGNHICNCGFAVPEEKNARGFGRKLLLHSLKKAKELGFTGMQFNLVVSNNKRAFHNRLNLN